MAVNDKQKIAVLDIAAGTQALIEAKLAEGYVITHICSLAPAQNKILIIYVIPEFI